MGDADPVLKLDVGSKDTPQILLVTRSVGYQVQKGARASDARSGVLAARSRNQVRRRHAQRLRVRKQLVTGTAVSGRGLPGLPAVGTLGLDRGGHCLLVKPWLCSTCRRRRQKAWEGWSSGHHCGTLFKARRAACRSERTTVRLR